MFTFLRKFPPVFLFIPLSQFLPLFFPSLAPHTLLLTWSLFSIKIYFNILTHGGYPIIVDAADYPTMCIQA